MKKIRVAIIKFGGMSAGGTEKFLHNIALFADSNRFIFHFFFCDSAPYLGSDFVHPGTDINVLKRFKDSHVVLREFKVDYKDVRSPVHEWINTNFFEMFNEKDYDVVLTGRAGQPEFPFNKIKHTPIVDSIHYGGGVDNQSNIHTVLSISEESKRWWINQGGDSKRVRLVSHPLIDKSLIASGDLKNALGITTRYVIGFHQRPSDEIYSVYPLLAFERISKHLDVSFVLLGGSTKYREQAVGMRNVFFIDQTSDEEFISKFLRTLDVYAHGRLDGEVNSTAIAEAMSMSLPVISHFGTSFNGHVEQIGNAGIVCANINDYESSLMRVLTDSNYRESLSVNARKKFESHYSMQSQINKIEDILIEASQYKRFDKLARLRLKNFLRRHFLRITRRTRAALKYAQ